MKKTLLGLLAAVVLLCGLNPAAEAGGSNQRRDTVLRVGATPVPHAELLALVADDLAAKGITLRIVDFTDYVLPNNALAAGELEANFFQHLPYLQQREEWYTALVDAFGVHIEPFGLYSQKFDSADALPQGASIAIPNDPTNGGRALLLLQARGLITLREDAGLSATPRDIVGNPRGFVFRELEAAQLPRALGDVDAAAINGNYALEAGLNPQRDALLIEAADSPYVNIVVVRRGMETDPRIVALRDALLSPRIKEFIDARYEGGVVAVF